MFIIELIRLQPIPHLHTDDKEKDFPLNIADTSLRRRWSWKRTGKRMDKENLGTKEKFLMATQDVWEGNDSPSTLQSWLVIYFLIDKQRPDSRYTITSLPVDWTTSSHDNWRPCSGGGCVDGRQQAMINRARFHNNGGEDI